MTAETVPLLRAVKNEDEKMLKPLKKNDIEKSENANRVSSQRSESYPANRFERGAAKILDSVYIKAPAQAIKTRLFLRRLFSSVLFPAPKLNPTIGATPMEYPINTEINTKLTYIMTPYAATPFCP